VTSALLAAPQARRRTGVQTHVERPALVQKHGPIGTEVAIVGSQVHVSSHRHLAEFGTNGFAFTPKDDRGLLRPSASVRYALERVSRGDVGLPLDVDQAPEVDGNQVRYERAAGVLEHYLALDDGIEQLYSFTEIPQGTGDLVIRGRIETSLEGQRTKGGGVRFAAPGDPTVSFGKARACDGLGRVVEADLVLAGGALEIHVPGDWLAAAKGPLLVDPLIDVERQLTDFAGDDEFVSIAYNATNNEFAIAYVNADQILAVSRLDGTGRLLQSGVIVDNSATTKYSPAICWSEASANRYLVAYGRDSEVWVVVLDRTLGVVSAATRIYDPPGTGENQTFPAVAYDPSRDRWTVVPLEDAGELLIDLTWGSFNTALSGIIALINLTIGNIFAGVDELCGKPFGIDWAVPNLEFEDIIVIEGGLWDIFGGEMTLGVFVMSKTGFIYTFQRSSKRVPFTIAEHAEGHHDQCEVWGPFYFFRIGLSSFWSALTNGRWHRWHWTEVGADDWAGQLFGPTRAGKRP
jgi:hypothetical protein